MAQIKNLQKKIDIKVPIFLCFSFLLIYILLTESDTQANFNQYIKDSFLQLVSLQFLILVPSIFILESLLPARRDEVGLSPSIIFDFVVTVFQLPIIAAALVTFFTPFSIYLSENASWAIVDTTRQLPIALTIFFAVVFTDLLAWLAHILKHKSFLWHFHTVHHSQERLNMFTANRTHPIDSVIDYSVAFLPLIFVFPSITDSAQNTMIYGAIIWWFIRFQHSNIKTNLGFLRYVLVTPQSHRIHHSVHSNHWSTNYSNIFAWDRLVGLQHSDDQTYPATGIDDKNFPEPKSYSPGEIFTCLFKQIIYPFKKVFRTESSSQPVVSSSAASKNSV